MKRLFTAIIVACVLSLPMAVMAEDGGAPELNPDEEIQQEDTGSLVDEENKATELSDTELRDPYLREYKDGEFIKVVERGIYLKSVVGYGLFIDQLDYSEGGILLGVGVGYDILDEWLQFELIAMVMGAEANVDTNGNFLADDEFGDAKVTGGHMSVFALGMINGTYQPSMRTLVKLRAGGGIVYDDAYINGFTKKMQGEWVLDEVDDVPAISGVVGGGLGFEYFTSMRHLSVGIDADFFYLLGPGSQMISITPNLKYTF